MNIQMIFSFSQSIFFQCELVAFFSPADIQSNIVMRVLASRSAAKTLSEKIVLLLNREGWSEVATECIISLPSKCSFSQCDHGERISENISRIMLPRANFLRRQSYLLHRIYLRQIVFQYLFILHFALTKGQRSKRQL